MSETRTCVECGKPLDQFDPGKAHFRCVTGGSIAPHATGPVTMLDVFAAAALMGRLARDDFGTPERVADDAYKTAFAMVKKRQEILRQFDPPDAQKS